MEHLRQRNVFLVIMEHSREREHVCKPVPKSRRSLPRPTCSQSPGGLPRGPDTQVWNGGSHQMVPKVPPFGAKTRSFLPISTWLPQGWWVLDSHQQLLHQLFSSEALGLDIKSPGDFQLLVCSCHTR